MTIYIRVDKATNEILSASVVGNSSAIPPDTATNLFIEITQAEKDAARAARDQMQADGRTDRPQWIAGAVVIPADTRPVFSAQVDKANIAANGVDQAILTVQKLTGAGGSVDPGFNATRFLEVPDELLERTHSFAFIFVDGVSAKVLIGAESFRVTIKSNPQFKIEPGPITITAHE